MFTYIVIVLICLAAPSTTSLPSLINRLCALLSPSQQLLSLVMRLSAQCVQHLLQTPRAPTNSSRAASIVNRRLSPNAPEMKHVDVSLQTTVLTNSNWGSFALLNGVNQGVSNYQRVGNKLSPVSVDVDFFVTNMTTTNFQPFRIALIWDKQPKTDGTLPSITDIWADVQSDGVIYCTPLSGRNYQTTDRFVCLASQECYLLANNVNSGGKHTQPTLDPFS